MPIPVESERPMSEELEESVESQRKAIGVVGARVESIFVPEVGVPRFRIRFPERGDSIRIRRELALHGYEVGQEMTNGGKALRFFVSKPVTEGGGWT